MSISEISAQQGCSWSPVPTNATDPIIWDGSADDNWQNSSNWNLNRIPDSNDDVLIPDDCPNDPRVYDSVNSGTVQIAPGAQLNWDGGTTAILNVREML